MRVWIMITALCVPSLVLGGDFDFNVVEPEVVLECSSPSHCEGDVWFRIDPAIRLKCNEVTPLEFVDQIRIAVMDFDPCSSVWPPYLNGDPSYSIVTFEGHPCPSDMNALCRISATMDRASLTLVNLSNCSVEGRLFFEITGAGNVRNCLDGSYTDPETGSSYSPLFLNVTTQVGITVPAISPTERETDYLSLKVVGPTAEVITYEDVSTYTALISVKNVHDADRVDLVLRFKDHLGRYVFLPDSIIVHRIDWTLDNETAFTGDMSSALEWSCHFPGREIEVRAYIYVEFDPGEGDPVEMTMVSNGIRLYNPSGVICPDGTDPLCHTIPPVIRPAGAPDRPIFTNAYDVNSDDFLDVADYDQYTGLDAGDYGNTDFVEDAYWYGGAARNGRWTGWVNDNAAGRLGYRYFTYVNANPWDVYELCPISEYQLPAVLAGDPGGITVGENTGYFNACLDPGGLECPRDLNNNPKWYLSWTTLGWWCIEYVCNFMAVGDGETAEINCE